MRIGLISDTHGLLRPQAIAALAGCDHIVHGGDVGADAILDALRAIAPLTAVRGNNDRSGRAGALPHAERIALAGVVVHVVHDLADLDVDLVADGIDVVVAGHSHRPRIDERGGVLYANPGSAGPRRFSLPVTVGELAIRDGRAVARIVPLAIR
jgi:putative phosphoesterase